MVKWLDKIIEHFEEIILVVLFGLMPLLCFFQVLCRFVFHFPAAWTEEVMRAMFVWTTFVGASLGVKYGAHLGVTAIVSRFPAKLRSIFMVIINVCCGLFCLFFAYSGLEMVMHQVSAGQLLPVSRIPVAWTTASMPVGFTLMVIRFFLNAIQTFKKDLMPSRQEQEETV
ncbi:MAG: TRAP transporter small permease [Desulfitobacteriia bacterium]